VDALPSGAVEVPFVFLRHWDVMLHHAESRVICGAVAFRAAPTRARASVRQESVPRVLRAVLVLRTFLQVPHVTLRRRRFRWSVVQNRMNETKGDCSPATGCANGEGCF